MRRACVKKISAFIITALLMISFSITAFAFDDSLFVKDGKSKFYYVYVTEDGTKYHTKECQYAYYNSSRRTITIYDALLEGYTPCDVCNPGKLDASYKEEFIEELEKENEEQEAETNQFNLYKKLGEGKFMEGYEYSTFEKAIMKVYALYHLLLPVVSIIVLLIFYVSDKPVLCSRKYYEFSIRYDKGLLWHNFFTNYLCRMLVVTIAMELIFVMFIYPAFWEWTSDLLLTVIFQFSIYALWLFLYFKHKALLKNPSFDSDCKLQKKCGQYLTATGCIYPFVSVSGSSFGFFIIALIFMFIMLAYFKRREDFFIIPTFYEPEKVATPIICNKCGTPSEHDSKFCPQCGHNFYVETYQKQADKKNISNTQASYVDLYKASLYAFMVFLKESNIEFDEFELLPFTTTISDYALACKNRDRLSPHNDLMSFLKYEGLLNASNIEKYDRRLTLYSEIIRGRKLRADWMMTDVSTNLFAIDKCTILLGDIIYNPKCADDYDNSPVCIGNILDNASFIAQINSLRSLALDVFNTFLNNDFPSESVLTKPSAEKTTFVQSADVSNENIENIDNPVEKSEFSQSQEPAPSIISNLTEKITSISTKKKKHSSTYEELVELQELLNMGIITQEDYDAKKKKILDI